MTLARQEMLESLPIRKNELTIRLCDREDLDRLADWPPYPFPHGSFDFSFMDMDPEERDRLFQSRQNDPNRITLAVDHSTQRAIGYLSLQQIDWIRREVANMGFRISPSWCNKGLGTSVLHAVSDWCFASGLRLLRLDVAASNIRAIRCYEKAGYVKTEEFWRNDKGLRGIDIDQPEYDFLRPHVRLDGAVPRLRFWWMELRKQSR